MNNGNVPNQEMVITNAAQLLMLRRRPISHLVSDANRVGLSWAVGSGAINLLKADLRVKLEQNLSPELMELLNESCGHTTPSGNKMHFHIYMVSSSF
ncbi:bolA family member 1 [Rhinolophus ferrumequinum]|uniref:BolA family member 1 n=1 Tax=Rhinolophus ferrumequinum TaxID=59479 RepID=A0A7J7W545_RHIFE|nr:bolA family member 1 [Rhinolophus ferrumequinum]